jgi:hypothetical protein
LVHPGVGLPREAADQVVEVRHVLGHHVDVRADVRHRGAGLGDLDLLGRRRLLAQRVLQLAQDLLAERVIGAPGGLIRRSSRGADGGGDVLGLRVRRRAHHRLIARAHHVETAAGGCLPEPPVGIQPALGLESSIVSSKRLQARLTRRHQATRKVTGR